MTAAVMVHCTIFDIMAVLVFVELAMVLLVVVVDRDNHHIIVKSPGNNKAKGSRLDAEANNHELM
jgi:hypothetical protein